jgi:anti-anti-sigma factor
MNIELHNGTLRVSGVRELSTVTARAFRSYVCEHMSRNIDVIEIDLSEARAVDGCGLGALMSIYKAANEQHPLGEVVVRLMHPPAPALQLFEFTRMHQIFDIVSNFEPSEINFEAISVSSNETRPSAVHIH